MEKAHLLAVFILVVVGRCMGTDEWSYRDPNGPSTWYLHYPACNGSHQSPIDIQHEVTAFENSLSDMTFELEASVPAKLLNDGKTIRVTFQSKNCRIQGKELEYTYRSFEVYFHWGSTDSQGSEHLFNGASSAMEIHIVHYNEKYENASVAMTQHDGLAVVSVLVDIRVTTNLAVQAVVEVLGNLTYNGTETSISTFPLASLLPAEQTHFYHYHGSLTTPGCFESVKWFVFQNKLQISRVQIEAFRSLYAVGPLAVEQVRLEDNFRPVQPLNERTVTRSFDDPHAQCTSTLREYTTVCSKLAGDKDVIYTVTVKPCARPVPVLVMVHVPDIGFFYNQTFVSDASRVQLGNLDFGFKLEFHSHPDGPNAGKLHLSFYQIHPLSSNPKRSKLFAKFYKIDGACKKTAVKCSSDASWKEQWCEKTQIGYDPSDTFSIAYGLTLKDVCRDSPSVSVKFYQKTSTDLHWTWTDVQTFTDGKQEKVHLTGHIVHNPQEALLSSEQTQSKKDLPESRWENMEFEAKIQKSENQVDFVLMLALPALKYKVLHAVFVHDKCKPSSGGLSSGTKIAIGITVTLVLIAIVGFTFGCLYCKRKKYFGHHQSLVQEIDATDANIDDNSL